MKNPGPASVGVSSPGSHPVAVLGGGASGQAARHLLESEGRSARLFDENGAERGDPHFDPTSTRFSFGVISPGFAATHPWRVRADDAGMPLMGETAYAASLWNGPVLCITGTNGKTTLTRFLEEALRKNGEEAYSCGNIGRPFSDLCREESGRSGRAVCEASSFQLYDWPQVDCEAGFWTNFDFDHLDWHPDMGGYFSAKWRLVQSGCPVFAGPSVLRWAGEFAYGIPENLIVVKEHPPFSTEQIGVFAGRPWNELFGLAHRWWLMTGRDEPPLFEAARNFVLSPHRMEPVGRVNDVSFVNDSKATNPHATLAAVHAGEGAVHWLGGGSWKAEDLFSLAKRLAGAIDSADTFGSTGEELAEILRREGCPARFHPGLREAFASAVSRAQPGSMVLLSPGFASFDQFGNYAERGETFRKLVEALRTAIPENPDWS